jgi:hypothetical protein
MREGGAREVGGMSGRPRRQGAGCLRAEASTGRWRVQRPRRPAAHLNPRLPCQFCTRGRPYSIMAILRDT